ncbi:MAG: TatD family hydrolase, partial [Candidatus Micrarchaeaceae archaeon]
EQIAAMLPAKPAEFGVPCSDRAAWKPLNGKFRQEIKQAEALMTKPFPAWNDNAYLEFSRTGSSEARRAADLGCYFSINSEMLSNERGHHLIAGLRADRILTETDGPFTRLDNRAACPTDVSHTVRMIADLHKVSAESIKSSLTQNLRRLVANDD